MTYVVVKTEHGPVKGVKKSTLLGRDYVRFSSIPFMKSPHGNLRFRDPQVPEKWTDVLDVTAKANHFPSISYVNGQCEGSVDSGVLSVSTPYIKAKLPVAVYIQGGGFQYSSPEEYTNNFDFILQKDIVCVFINYRRGPMGFLSLNDPSIGIPGNAGLKDQLLGLKWVKNNIAQFGGDPDNITLFGTSAGGASVHFHMISEQSKGLFKRAIPMSGTASIKTWPIMTKKGLTERLAKALSWDGTGGDAGILKVLEECSVEELCIAESKLLTKEEIYNEYILFPFTPVIEPYVTETTFIPQDPVLMARNAWSSYIDCMVGGTSLEGGLITMFGGNYLDYFKTASDFVPLDVFGLEADDKPKVDKIGNAIKKLYFGDKTPSADTLREYLLSVGDMTFLHGIYCSVMSRVKSSGVGKTYFYRFDIQTDLSLMRKFLSVNEEGALHGDCMSYLFKMDMPGATLPALDSFEFGLMKKMVDIVTSFIITGDPNCESLETTWEPSDDSVPVKCLNMTNDSFEMIPLPEQGRFEVLDSLFKDVNVPIY